MFATVGSEADNRLFELSATAGTYVQPSTSPTPTTLFYVTTISQLPAFSLHFRYYC